MEQLYVLRFILILLYLRLANAVIVVLIVIFVNYHACFIDQIAIAKQLGSVVKETDSPSGNIGFRSCCYCYARFSVLFVHLLQL